MWIQSSIIAMTRNKWVHVIQKRITLLVYKRTEVKNWPKSYENEPLSEKTGLRGFRPGPTQTGLYGH